MCIINVSFYRAYCLEHGEQQEQPIRAANQPNTPLPNQTGKTQTWTKNHPPNKELGPKSIPRTRSLDQKPPNEEQN